MQKLKVLGLSAESHDMLDAGPVVPAAIEQDDFATRGKMGHISLEVPLCFFPLGGCAQSDHTAYARVEALGNPLDGAALAGSVSAFKDTDHFQCLMPYPLL